MDKILEGATIWARKTIDSDVFYNKPAEWFKIWFFIVSKVNHKNVKQFNRSQGFFKYEWIEKNCMVTKNQVDGFIRWAKLTKQITTQKTTQGFIITVLNYHKYQQLNNYRTDTENDTKTEIKPKQNRNRNDTINNNDKNVKNDKKAVEEKIPNRLILSRGMMIAFAKSFKGLTTKEIEEQRIECNSYMNMSSSTYNNPGLFFKGWLRKYTENKRLEESKISETQRINDNLPVLPEEVRLRNLTRVKQMRKKVGIRSMN